MRVPRLLCGCWLPETFWRRISKSFGPPNAGTEDSSDPKRALSFAAWPHAIIICRQSRVVFAFFAMSWPNRSLDGLGKSHCPEKVKKIPRGGCHTSMAMHAHLRNIRPQRDRLAPAPRWRNVSSSPWQKAGKMTSSSVPKTEKSSPPARSSSSMPVKNNAH